MTILYWSLRATWGRGGGVVWQIDFPPHPRPRPRPPIIFPFLFYLILKNLMRNDCVWIRVRTAMFVDPKSTICVWVWTCWFVFTCDVFSHRLAVGRRGAWWVGLSPLTLSVYSLPSLKSRQIPRGISIVILIADWPEFKRVMVAERYISNISDSVIRLRAGCAKASQSTGKINLHEFSLGQWI